MAHTETVSAGNPQHRDYQFDREPGERVLFHLVLCFECSKTDPSTLPLPFLDPRDMATWVTKHSTNPGHSKYVYFQDKR